MFNLTETLNNIKEFAESEKPLDFLLIAVNEAKADFQNRIFNSEEGTKDNKGKGLGKYSNAYASFRKAKGRQAKVVDLEFTGSLRRDIKVVKTEDRVFINILSDAELRKVEYLEENYKTKIFTLNDEEVVTYENKALKLFIREIDRIWKNE